MGSNGFGRVVAAETMRQIVSARFATVLVGSTFAQVGLAVLLLGGHALKAYWLISALVPFVAMALLGLWVGARDGDRGTDLRHAQAGAPLPALYLARLGTLLLLCALGLALAWLVDRRLDLPLHTPDPREALLLVAVALLVAGTAVPVARGWIYVALLYLPIAAGALLLLAPPDATLPQLQGLLPVPALALPAGDVQDLVRAALGASQARSVAIAFVLLGLAVLLLESRRPGGRASLAGPRRLAAVVALLMVLGGVFAQSGQVDALRSVDQRLPPVAVQPLDNATLLVNASYSTARAASSSHATVTLSMPVVPGVSYALSDLQLCPADSARSCVALTPGEMELNATPTEIPLTTPRGTGSPAVVVTRAAFADLDLARWADAPVPVEVKGTLVVRTAAPAGLPPQAAPQEKVSVLAVMLPAVTPLLPFPGGFGLFLLVGLLALALFFLALSMGEDG